MSNIIMFYNYWHNAEVARPLSPLKPEIPVPATVVMIPLLTWCRLMVIFVVFGITAYRRRTYCPLKNCLQQAERCLDDCAARSEPSTPREPRREAQHRRTNRSLGRLIHAQNSVMDAGRPGDRVLYHFRRSEIFIRIDESIKRKREREQ